MLVCKSLTSKGRVKLLVCRCLCSVKCLLNPNITQRFGGCCSVQFVRAAQQWWKCGPVFTLRLFCSKLCAGCTSRCCYSSDALSLLLIQRELAIPFPSRYRAKLTPNTITLLLLHWQMWLMVIWPPTSLLHFPQPSCHRVGWQEEFPFSRQGFWAGVSEKPEPWWDLQDESESKGRWVNWALRSQTVRCVCDVGSSPSMCEPGCVTIGQETST